LVVDPGEAKRIPQQFRAKTKDVGESTLARFTVELQARRGLLTFSRGEKV